jgi:hypothetical protein
MFFGCFYDTLPIQERNSKMKQPVTIVQDSLPLSDSNPIPVTFSDPVITSGPAGICAAITLALDTEIYADGDVLSDTAEIEDAVRDEGACSILESVLVQDDDDQGAAMTLVFLQTNVALGTKNAAVSISDANALKILGTVSVASGDYQDLGGVKIACLKNIRLMLQAAAASTSIFVAAISKGTGTYTASGVKLRIGLMRD